MDTDKALTFDPSMSLYRCPNAKLSCRVCGFSTDVPSHWTAHFDDIHGSHGCKMIGLQTKDNGVTTAEMYDRFVS